MKYSHYSAALLLALVPAGLAQESTKGTILPVPQATVTHVDHSPACDPGLVEVLGTNLELITNARINGVEVPMLANDGERIVLAPPPQDPGFLRLDLAQPYRVLTETIEFTPSLSGRWLDSHVRLRLNPGGSGWYILNYSFRTRRIPLVYENVHYGEMLDMSTPYSGQLAGGLLDGSTVLLPFLHAPRGLTEVGGLGINRPMSVQAFCMIDGDLCYSNLYTVTPDQ